MGSWWRAVRATVHHQSWISRQSSMPAARVCSGSSTAARGAPPWAVAALGGADGTVCSVVLGSRRHGSR